MNIRELFDAQRAFFRNRVTADVAYRRQALKSLRKAILQRESRLCAALQEDLGKSAREAYMSEIGMVLSSLSCALRHLGSWTRIRRVSAPMAHFPSSCRVMPEPYGVALIISPWNYPLLLCLDPLIAALAAGNCCIVKPSEYAPATAAAIRDLLSEIFPRDYVSVVEGETEVSRELSELPFDYIFFTGSTAVGRYIMEAAARNLTPVTLELGGKSPCIIDESAKMGVTARRIAFGKVLNAGQTCVAPDYVLVPRKRLDEFVEEFRLAVREMLGEAPLLNPDYVHIINRRHFDRIKALMAGAEVSVGGGVHEENLRIEPTLLTGVTAESPCMQEEIFGPLLPVIPYDYLAEAENLVLSRPKPLACYIFTESRRVEQGLLERLSFGGGCVNDTIVHLAAEKLPFGGVGASGIGAYHGKAGFDTFTHYKSILHKATWLDLPFRYHPISSLGNMMLRFFLR